MMRLRFLIVFYCFGILINLKAQTPGYMGKKLVVGYGFFANPSFRFFSVTSNEKLINIQHEIFLEYSFARNVAIGASVGFFKHTYNNTEKVNANYLGSSGNFSQLTEKPNGVYDIKSRRYKFYLKFYKSGYLAPWGKYFILGLALNNYQTIYDSTNMYVEAYRYSSNGLRTRVYSNFGEATQSFKQVDLFFGNGNSRIFANRIVLDYGYSIGLASTFKFILRFDEVAEDLHPDSYIESTSSRRVAAINSFNFFIKVGYLF